MKSSQITHKSQQAFNKWMLPDEKQLNQGEEKIVAFEKKKRAKLTTWMKITDHHLNPTELRNSMYSGNCKSKIG